MELVKIDVYGEAYYSGSVYREERWLTKDTYEKIKDEIPAEIYLGELDGKHSEVLGEVGVFDYNHEDLISLNPLDLEEDGDELWEVISNLCLEVGVNYTVEGLKIQNYLLSLDSYVYHQVKVKRSQIQAVNDFVKGLGE